MVQALVSEGILKTTNIIDSLRKVPREMFVSDNLGQCAYVDTPLPTDQGQTISAPHMVAMMNEALEAREGMKILEVGAGSGYHAATLAEIVGNTGRVFAIEQVETLVSTARRNLTHAGYADRVVLVQGDGSQGYPDRAPYDRVLVTAAAPKVPPPLLSQLGPEGILVIPIGGRMFPQELIRITKNPDGTLSRQSLGGVAFVPLIGKYGFSH